MKKLLSILASITIVAPVSGITISAVQNQQNSNLQSDRSTDEASASSIVGWGDNYNSTKINDGNDSDPNYSHTVADFGHQQKVKLEDKRELKGKSIYAFASNSYSVDDSTTLPISIDDNGKSDQFTGESEATYSSAGKAPHNVVFSDKTFIPNKDGNELLWVDRNSDNELTFRSTGMKYNNTLRRNTLEFVPFQYLNNDKTSTNYILTDGTDPKEKVSVSKNLVFYNVDTLEPVDSSLSNEKIFPSQTFDMNALLKGTDISDNSEWNVKSFVALSDAKTGDSFVNKILVGFTKEYKSNSDLKCELRFYAYDVLKKDNGEISLEICKDSNGIAKSIIMNGPNSELGLATNNSFTVFSETKSGDIFVNIGLAHQSSFLASYFIDSNEKKVFDGFKNLDAINPLTAAFKSIDYNYYDINRYNVVDSSFTPIDRHNIFEISVGTKSTEIADNSQRKFYGADIDFNESTGKMEFTNVHWLFTSDAQNNDNPNIGNMIVGSMTNDSGIEYNYIAYNSLSSKVIIYKYKFNESDTDETGYGKEYTSDLHSLDSTDHPVVETALQTMGSKSDVDISDNGFSQVCLYGLFYLDNNLFTEVVTTNQTAREHNYSLLSVSAKIENNDINKLLSSVNVELTQSIFNNILVAYPNLERSNSQIRKAFLQSMILGVFEYDKFNTGESTKNGDIAFKSIDVSGNQVSFLGKIKQSSNANLEKLSLLLNNDSIDFRVDGVSLEKEKQESKSYFVNISSGDINSLLRNNSYGISNREVNLTFQANENNKNSLLEGQVKIHVISKNINAKLDVSDINQQLITKIKSDYSDLNITGFNTVNEVTGYIINKFNDVIFDESKKYSSDSEIAKFLRDFTLNSPIANQTIANTAWKNYYTIDSDSYKPTKSVDKSIYRDAAKYDGIKPYSMLNDKISINSYTYGSEYALRSEMGWGFQDSNLQKKVSEDPIGTNETFSLSNILLTTLSSDYISSNRTDGRLIYDKDHNPDGIIHYTYTDSDGNDYKDKINIVSNSVILNLANNGNVLRATLPNSQNLKTLYDKKISLDSLASDNLDKVAKELKNQVIGGKKYNDTNSIYRVFHEMRKKMNIPSDIQLALFVSDFDGDGDLLQLGDKRVEIVVYDALFFNGFSKASVDNSHDSNFNSNGNYRVINIYLSNVGKKTSEKFMIITLAILSSVLFALLFGYTVWVSKRKSFYKHATTREMAKMTYYKNKEEKHNKKNKK